MGRSLHDDPTELTWHQELELLCGPAIGPNWPASRDDDKIFIPERSNFASEAERQEAWNAHREEILDEGDGTAWAEEHYDGAVGT